ncbi:hypothetical protein [Alkalimarinus alittae]|uniref:Chromosome partition protein Smc n=1 Tax=Alkalimarinus alittae TaxID=2961619 RepID=A0ABY6N5T4_9ALTE|nr:hypothetical protein [Alkalimarinus alittae]UZE97439.1 hypothetical protein NKI27_06735 [Alkalimarinus alittae]
MEGLRPDRDEVDNFQRSRNTGKGAGKQKANPSISADKKGAAKTTASKPPKAPKTTKSSSPMLVWLMLVVIAGVVSWFGWESYQQKQVLKATTAELQDALVFVRQSKLLMARLEGELSETGAELIESDTGAQKKMAFLESEIRKLWGIAYDRNRKAIAANNGDIKQQGTELKSISSTVSKQAKGVEALVSKVDSLTAKIDKETASTAALQTEVSLLREQNSQLLGQLKSIEDASGSAIAEIRQSIDKLKDTKAVEGRVRLNEVAIEAIDASRLQLNERIVAIDRRLNDLQLSIKSSQPTAAP